MVFTQNFINAGITTNVTATPINSQDPIAEMMFRALGRATNCEVTKAARQNIVQRVFTNNPSVDLGRAIRYLTTAQRRQYRALHPGTRAQQRAVRTGSDVIVHMFTGHITGDELADRLADINYERALWASHGVQLDHQMLEQPS